LIELNVGKVFTDCFKKQPENLATRLSGNKIGPQVDLPGEKANSSHADWRVPALITDLW
jgi:hypothetical protein